MSNENNKNNKFKFVNQNEESDFLIEETESNKKDLKPKPEKTPEERAKIAKQQKRQRNLLAAMIMSLITGVFFLLGLLWQDATDLMAITNAFTLAFAIELFAAWIMFVYNKNILSPLIHGAKTFILMFVGKRPKQDYYHYMKQIEANQLPKFYINVIFISAALTAIPMIALLIVMI